MGHDITIPRSIKLPNAAYHLHAFAGANLSEAIMSPETVLQSEAATENETDSEVDVDALSLNGQDLSQNRSEKC